MTILRCIDVETTGVPTETETHALVEVAYVDLVNEPDDPPYIGEFFSALCNPGRPIPHEAMAVHHITDDMVKDAKGSASDLGTPDYFVAHNADFERQFIQTEVPFICTYKVALRIWPEATSHGLQFLRYHVGLDVKPDLCQPPHRALPDAYLCAELMRFILNNGSVSLDEMVRWSSGPALLPRVTFGKHKGADWKDVPTDYLVWLVEKSDMDRDVKANARHHLKSRGN